jgi:hypothetical protein
MNPNPKTVLKLGSQVSGVVVVETEVLTADNQPVVRGAWCFSRKK